MKGSYVITKEYEELLEFIKESVGRWKMIRDFPIWYYVNNELKDVVIHDYGYNSVTMKPNRVFINYKGECVKVSPYIDGFKSTEDYLSFLYEIDPVGWDLNDAIKKHKLAINFENKKVFKPYPVLELNKTDQKLFKFKFNDEDGNEVKFELSRHYFDMAQDGETTKYTFYGRFK